MALNSFCHFLLHGLLPEAKPGVLGSGKCVQVQAAFAEIDEIPVDSGGRTVRLDIRLPPLEMPLPPVTHVFGL